MEVSEAIQLIRPANLTGPDPVKWADLGCGSGTFTYALAALLPPYSTVYAFDIRRQVFNDPGIQFFQLDVEKHVLPVPPLTGILMANFLHYIENALSFIIKLKDYLLPDGKIILVEYDSGTSNRWVPYPISQVKAKKLSVLAGFDHYELLAIKKSIYQDGVMYAVSFS